jgi:hypothetical protein
MRFISFKTPAQTKLLQSLLSPDRAVLRKLLKSLPRKPGVSDDLLDGVIEEMCTMIRSAASTEAQRHGWHRASGTKKATEQLQRLANAAMSYLKALEALRREALEAMYPYGHASAASVLDMRNAALRALERLKAAPPRPSPGPGHDPDRLKAEIKAVGDAAYRAVTGTVPPGTSDQASQQRRGSYPWFLEQLFTDLGMRGGVEYQIKKGRRPRYALSKLDQGRHSGTPTGVKGAKSSI